MEEERGLLAGVRVIDFSRALSGPYCTMLLGDQGAEVIKIERPGTGDDTRQQSNPMVGNENSAFLAVNRNKRSVVIDLKSAAGVGLVRRLIDTADVLVENFRPGKAAALGIGWEEVSRTNPGLIYCSISGWGADGPLAARGGYASTAEAAGGLMAVTGEPDRPPVKVGVSLIDNVTGLFAKDAITAALFARTRTGRGQRVDTSLLESTVATLSMSAYAYLLGGIIPGRHGSEHQWNVPWKALPTSDGYVMICSSSDDQWRKLCAGMGRDDLAADGRFVTQRLRAENREVLYVILGEILATRPTDEWIHDFDAVGAAAAPINTMDKVFTDSQVLHRGMLQSVHHTTLGDIPQVGHAQKFSDTPARIVLPPPTLGEHTDEVLTSVLGCDQEELAVLRADGVIA